MKNNNIITEREAPICADSYGNVWTLRSGDQFKIEINGELKEFTVVDNDYYVKKARDERKAIAKQKNTGSKIKNTFTIFGRSKVNIYG